MKKRIINYCFIFVLVNICFLTIVFCCCKKSSALSETEFLKIKGENVASQHLTSNNFPNGNKDYISLDNGDYIISIVGSSYDNDIIDLFIDATNYDAVDYRYSFVSLHNLTGIDNYYFFSLASNTRQCYLTYQIRYNVKLDLSINIFTIDYSQVGKDAIVDSNGNVILDNQIYYSQSNYINYGVDNYNDGLNSYYDGIEPMVLSNGTYYGGSSFVGINNDTPTRLYYSFDYGNDYLTFGGLNLSGDYDSYLLNIGFKDDYSITKVSFTPATSVTACIINGTRYTNVMYDGSYYYIDIPHIVSSEISFELSPRNDSSSISKNIKIEGIPDLTTLIYNSYYKGYNNGLESNQDKINLLEQQLNDGFNLFTPVTSFLNMKLSEFDILGTHFNLTFGLLLSFVLGLTAIFIIVKIFK